MVEVVLVVELAREGPLVSVATQQAVLLRRGRELSVLLGGCGRPRAMPKHVRPPRTLGGRNEAVGTGVAPFLRRFRARSSLVLVLTRAELLELVVQHVRRGKADEGVITPGRQG
jgi:hypothetical protein